MSEEWFVRVQGKDYGPVALEELREWKAEGRLIAENEVRRDNEEDWARADSFPEIFGLVIPPPLPGFSPIHARSWGQILRETFRIYRLGLGRLLLFSLLSAVPMFALQWSLPAFKMPDLSPGASHPVAWPTLSPTSIILLLLVLALWPISTAAFQFVADDLMRGENRSLGAQLRAALARWSTVLGAGLVVYGSYLFWFLVPFLVLINFASALNSAVNALLFLAIATFMIYINARLFINFLFWHQTSALGARGVFGSLLESKELARSAPDAQRTDRPLYRGAIIASVWLLLLLILSFSAQLPFVITRFIGITNPEAAIALAQSVAESPTPDKLTLLADLAGAFVNLLMQPLLAVVFVVLYHDARARNGDATEL